jgi:Hypothetical protein (DUF2513)
MVGHSHDLAEANRLRVQMPEERERRSREGVDELLAAIEEEKLMKRDMDLIRELLLRIEALDIDAGSVHMLEIYKEPLAHQGDDPNKIYYNMRLLMEAGFVAQTSTQGADSFMVTGLTWVGHDFLDSIRDPVIWKKTKDGVKAAGGFTVSLLAELAKGLIKTQVEKHTGVKL